MPLLNVSEPVYRELARIKEQIGAEKDRRVTFTEALEHLIELEKTTKGNSDDHE